MDRSRGPPCEDTGVSIKKKRSQTSRRPRPDGQPLPDLSPHSLAPTSDDTSKVSSDENTGDGIGNSAGKMFNVNQCVSRSLPVGVLNGVVSNGTCDGAGSQHRPRKVKLKLKHKSNGESGSGSTIKVSQSSDDARPQQRLITQESSDEYHSPPRNKKGSLQGVPWMDFSKGNFSFVREEVGRKSTKNTEDSVRKSKRVPKRRVLDGEFDGDYMDDEMRYMEKLKTSKMPGFKDLEAHSTRKVPKGMKNEITEDFGRRNSKKLRVGDTDSDEEEEVSSDRENDGKNKKKGQKKDLSEIPTENKRDLTTRQRALLSKDVTVSGSNQIEFPNGLPPPPSRKQKEKLTEVEQQLKKAEAAQKRKLQNEKAARESEAEAIRKILGQDSSRKKREEKIKKRQEELAQEKATNAQMLLSSNTIRTVMGPTGTTVTFPQEMGLPRFFESYPCSYPPPREKCAGPSCTNAYRYRDSKSKLPLCSLQCYKAVNEKLHAERAC